MPSLLLNRTLLTMLTQIFGKFISARKLFASWVSVKLSHLMLHIHIAMMCKMQTRIPKSAFPVSFLFFSC